MRAITNARIDEEQALALIRRLGELRAIASKLKHSRMSPLQVCEAVVEKRFAERGVRSFFADLPDDERHYWIASLYALLMPEGSAQTARSVFHPAPSRSPRDPRYDGCRYSAGPPSYSRSCIGRRGISCTACRANCPSRAQARQARAERKRRRSSCCLLFLSTPCREPRSA